MKSSLSLRMLMIAIAVLGSSFTVCIVGLHWNRPQSYGINVDASQCPMKLPPGATGICYAVEDHFPGATAYEFTTTRAALMKWEPQVVAVNGVDWREISEPVIMPRYSVLVPGVFASRRVTITRGLVHSSGEMDQLTYLVFDAESGRVYFFSFMDARPYEDWPPEQYQ